MNASNVLNFDALLAPITGGAGRDPRGGSAFAKLVAAQDDARNLEKQRDQPFDKGDPESVQAFGEASARLPEAWRNVRQHAEDILRGEGKDFEVAALLIEALLRLEGLPGLTEATRLLVGLVESYWHSGYPGTDSNELGKRAARIGRLAGEGDEDEPRTGPGGVLLVQLRRLPLFIAPDGEQRALWNFTKRDGTLDLDRALREGRSDPKALRAVGSDAAAALEAWRALEAALDGRFPAKIAPPTQRVRQVLERMIRLANQFGPLPSEPPPPPAGGGAAPQAPAAAAGSAAGAIATREEALRQLEFLAAFFRRTEPQSPLSYTLDDAVRRARMTLPELLSEVVADEGNRAALLTALGIRPPASEP